MNSLQDRLSELCEEFISECKHWHARQGVVASGKTTNDYSYEHFPNSTVIHLPRTLPILEKGRNKGGVPPIAVFEQWLTDKGIRPVNDAEAKAWAKNIWHITAKAGSYKFRKKITTPIWDEPYEHLSYKLQTLLVNYFDEQVRATFNR